jgi:hypothetical protein
MEHFIARALEAANCTNSNNQNTMQSHIKNDNQKNNENRIDNTVKVPDNSFENSQEEQHRKQQPVEPTNSTATLNTLSTNPENDIEITVEVPNNSFEIVKISAQNNNKEALLFYLQNGFHIVRNNGHIFETAIKYATNPEIKEILKEEATLRLKKSLESGNITSSIIRSYFSAEADFTTLVKTELDRCVGVTHDQNLSQEIENIINFQKLLQAIEAENIEKVTELLEKNLPLAILHKTALSSALTVEMKEILKEEATKHLENYVNEGSVTEEIIYQLFFAGANFQNIKNKLAYNIDFDKIAKNIANFQKLDEHIQNNDINAVKLLLETDNTPIIIENSYHHKTALSSATTAEMQEILKNEATKRLGKTLRMEPDNTVDQIRYLQCGADLQKAKTPVRYDPIYHGISTKPCCIIM